MDHPDLGSIVEQIQGATQEVRCTEARIVVDEQQDVARNVGHPGVATCRDADVLRQGDRADRVRKSFGLPTVADDDDVEFHVLLTQDRVQGGSQIIGTSALGQDDHAYLAPNLDVISLVHVL